jgi:hypothetical protein
VLTQALAYLRVILSSKDPTRCLSLCQKLTDPQRPDYSIAHRWRTVMGQDWDSLPERPTPLVVDRATKQHSIERSLEQRAKANAIATCTHRTRILLNFPAKGRARAPRRQAGSKRGWPTIIEPLKGSDAPGINRPYNKSWLAVNQDASVMAVAQLGWKNSWSNKDRNIAPSGKPSNNII